MIDIFFDLFFPGPIKMAAKNAWLERVKRALASQKGKKNLAKALAEAKKGYVKKSGKKSAKKSGRKS